MGRSTQTKIMEAAADCFARRGYHAASTEEIAEKAGVAKGSIYYNFNSKDELLYAVIRWGLDLLHEESRRIVESNDPESEILRQLIRIYADLILDYPSLAEVVFASQLAGVKPEWAAKINSLREEAVQQVAAMLTTGAEAGIITPLNYSLAAAGFFGLVWQVCARFIRNGNNKEREPVYQVLQQIFFHGIRRNQEASRG